ncbi:MAG: S9 family peptidase [Firmicutes bacterium]|nr:S9 family peptidase [Bacillota bacterium]
MKTLNLEDFTKYTFLSGLQYAPSGNMYAFVKAGTDLDKNRYTYDLWLGCGDDLRRLTAGGEESQFVWEDERHILFAANRSEDEKKKAEEAAVTQFYRIAVDGGEAEPAFCLPLRVQQIKNRGPHEWWVLGGVSLDHPDEYRMDDEARKKLAETSKEDADYEVLTEINFYRNGAGYVDRKRTVLFLYDDRDGSLKQISEIPANASMPVEKSGRLYYISVTKDQSPMGRRMELAVYDLVSGETMYHHDDKLDPHDVFVIGDRLVVAASKHFEYTAQEDTRFYLWEDGEYYPLSDEAVALGDGTVTDVTLGHGRDVRETPGALYFVRLVRHSDVLSVLTPDGRITDLVTASGAINDFDVSADGEIRLIGLYGRKLQEIYAPQDGHLRQISSFNEAVLQDVYISDYHPLKVQSEGWEIDGWVLYPKDYDPAKRYPAILDIHGGPRAAYGEIFFHEMQLWANRGFFVMFCNPVGGLGRGYDFANLNDRYGEIDYRNIMDFVDAVLAEYPAIDPERLGCTGGSYGGFMSNWILGHTDRFKAIATQRSISNWISFYGVSDIGYFFNKCEHGADIYSEEGLARLWRHSPLKYINNMHTPTLIIHSDQDYRCPLEQGLQLFTALREKGVPARLCLFKGENHELSRSGKPKHRIRRLREITDWLEHYTGREE